MNKDGSLVGQLIGASVAVILTGMEMALGAWLMLHWLGSPF